MDTTSMILAGGTMLVLAVAAGYVLGWAKKAFHVEVDPRITSVLDALPGANCGGCGYVGCADYAEVVVTAGVAPDKCPVGGVSCTQAVAGIMGLDLKPSWPFRPVVHCRATYKERLGRRDYRGEQTCTAANLCAGVQGCTYGCLGLSDCVRACDYDAIHIDNGLAVVDYEKCIGCGACAEICPRNIITMAPFKQEQMLVVGCANKDFGKDVKAVCTIGCIGCKACSRASTLFTFTDGNLPTINYDEYDPSKMDSLMVSVEKCPVKGLIFVGKPSPKDLAQSGEKQLPELIEVDFKTTVDDAEWRG